jgi:dynein intermediate chain 2, axonemal
MSKQRQGENIDHSAETPNARTLTVFRDPSTDKRSASYICMHPSGAKRVAVAYSIMHFQKQPEDMDIRSYIWDLNNSSKPEFELHPASQLCCLQFNPKDDHVIGGGQVRERR